MRKFVVLPLLFLLIFASAKVIKAAGADVNSDGKVDIIDIGIVIDNYGQNPPANSKTDINLDGLVNIIDIGIVIDSYGKPSPSTPGSNQSWENGTVRYLPELSGNLTSFVSSLPHPNSGYNTLSGQKEAAFNTFFSSFLNSITQMRSSPNQDWCSIKAKAAAAGYSVSRFYDTVSGRYFIYAKDVSGDGQAHFFFNPSYSREIVIEAPHAGYETNTDSQGAKLLVASGAQALIINGGDRCSTSTLAQCSGSSSACGSYKASDVAHDTRNTFHKAHILLSNFQNSKFIQLHGMSGSASHVIEASDGSTGKAVGASSNKISTEIRKHVPNASSIYSCQEGLTPSGLCGTSNVQGRYTNGGGASNTCGTTVSSSQGRFIHIEQSPGIRDDSESDGLSWSDVNSALISVWPSCTTSGCSLGAKQAQTANCTCGLPCN